MVAKEGQSNDADGTREARNVKVLPTFFALLRVLRNHLLGQLITQCEESNEYSQEDEKHENDAQ